MCVCARMDACVCECTHYHNKQCASKCAWVSVCVCPCACACRTRQPVFKLAVDVKNEYCNIGDVETHRDQVDNRALLCGRWLTVMEHPISELVAVSRIIRRKNRRGIEAPSRKSITWLAPPVKSTRASWILPLRSASYEPWSLRVAVHH